MVQSLSHATATELRNGRVMKEGDSLLSSGIFEFKMGISSVGYIFHAEDPYLMNGADANSPIGTK